MEPVQTADAMQHQFEGFVAIAADEHVVQVIVEGLQAETQEFLRRNKKAVQLNVVQVEPQLLLAEDGPRLLLDTHDFDQLVKQLKFVYLLGYVIHML